MLQRMAEGEERMSSHGGRELMHAGHIGISSGTWRASVGLRWAPVLGLLQAELDLGPKIKFEAHVIPSNFH
jgi:hypothetical protein